MIDKISFDKKVGSDINEYLIELLKYIQDPNNELPFEITEEEYNKVKNNKDDYPKWYVGLVGFCATFGAKWFGGYARAFKSDKVTPRNMSNEAIRNLENQRKHLQGIKFIHRSFDDYGDVRNAVIYCDIPYRDTTKYNKKTFTYDKFYKWCRDMKTKGNIVLVSEYNMPSDFECIWEKEHTTIVSVRDKKHDKRIERLYILK